MSRTLKTMLAAGIAALAMGCSFDCTLVGCLDGLIVELASAPTGAYTVSLIVNGAVDGTNTYTCSGTSLCSAWFNNYRGTDPLVRVTTSAGTKDTQFHGITYDARYPNGRSCGAACYNATVTAAIP